MIMNESKLQKQKVSLEFKCHCDYCKKYMKIIFFLKNELEKDIVQYIIQISLQNDILEYINADYVIRFVELKLINIKSRLSTLNKEKERAGLFLESIKTINYKLFDDIKYDENKPSFFNIPKSIITNTKDIIKDFDNKIIDFQVNIELVTSKLQDKKDSKNYYLEICKNHNKKIVDIKNLNAYNLYTTDEEQRLMIQKYFHRNLFTSILSFNDTKIYSTNWREIESRCCKYCHLFGHFVEKCKKKHCYVLCKNKNCDIEYCKTREFKCWLDHCKICCNHSHNTLDCPNLKNKKIHK